MNDLIRKSLIENVRSFTDPLSDEQLSELINYFVYEVNLPDRRPANDLETKFIEVFFTAKDWENHLIDLTKTRYFLLASYALRTNLELIQKLLLSQAYFRFMSNLGKEPQPKVVPKSIKPKESLTPSEKKQLKEILDEYKCGLEYHLEDEDLLNKYDETGELVKTKKKQLKFIENFFKKIW